MNQPWLERCQYFDALASTMDQAKTLAHEHAPEGTTVIARSQDQGRGRYGSSWSSEPDAGLWFTTLLYPQQDLSLFPTLTLMSAVACVEALEKLDFQQLSIQWPNDLLCHEKKFAGILLENLEVAAKPQPQKVVLLGIGVNLLTPQEQHQFKLPAIGLNEMCANTDAPCLEPAALLAALLSSLQARYQQWQHEGPAPSLKAWSAYDALAGQTISGQSRQTSETVTGKACGIDPSGQLRLQTPDGRIHLLQSADILKIQRTANSSTPL